MRRGRGSYSRQNNMRNNIKLKLRFSFPAVLALLICTDKEGTALLCLIGSLLHEMGHLIVMLIEKKPPSEIILYGGGIHIHGGSRSFPATLAGPMTNILLFVLFMLILPDTGNFRLFAVINLILAAVNLLPVKELDGRRILECSFIGIMPPERAMKAVDIAERAALIIVLPSVILLVFSGYMSFSAIIFFFYLLAVDIFDKM